MHFNVVNFLNAFISFIQNSKIILLEGKNYVKKIKKIVVLIRLVWYFIQIIGKNQFCFADRFKNLYAVFFELVCNLEC